LAQVHASGGLMVTRLQQLDGKQRHANNSSGIMSLHVHHVPGRLRLRLRHLQGRRGACNDASASAAAIEGVIEACANPATGSLTIHYDQGRLTAACLWRSLCDRYIVWGLSPITEGALVTRAELQPPGDPRPGHRLLETVGAMVIDKLVERWAVCLVAALI
jgi:hypothetical protein